LGGEQRGEVCDGGGDERCEGVGAVQEVRGCGGGSGWESAEDVVWGEEGEGSRKDRDEEEDLRRA
jgi:hypothetical protein